MDDDGSGSSGPNANSKIDRLIERYELGDIAAELESLWTRTDDSYSIRELATYFNKSVLRAALRNAGTDPLAAEVDTIYGVLTGEQVDAAERVEVEERLAEADIDGDALADDFVSHQTVYNYLTKEREVEYSHDVDPEERLQNANQSTQKMKNRLNAVAKSNLGSLDSADLLTLGDYDVINEVYVYCQDCGGRYPVGEVIDRGGCDCADGSD